MANSIKAFVNIKATTWGGNGSLLGTLSVWINPNEWGQPPTLHSDYNVANLRWAIVLDRKDLSKPPLFNAALPDSTSVPSALQSVLSPDALLIFGVASGGYNIPQGAQYDMLVDAGARGPLERFELLGSYQSSALLSRCVYMLVGIPGAGVAAIETADQPLISVLASENTSAAIGAPNLTQVLSMVEGSDGYYPILIE